MATYIARDVRPPHPSSEPTSVELLLDLGAAGKTVVATFKGATGARLYGKLIRALAKAGDTVYAADGTCLAGSIEELKP